MGLLRWDIHELTASEPLIKVMCRGRIRKFCLQNNINVLTENASDKENCVRFAVVEGTSVEPLAGFLQSIFKEAKTEKVLTTSNPVLSKLLINKEERYEI